jgi:hypothetical protein
MPRVRAFVAAAVLAVFLSSCGSDTAAMNEIAESYVKLALALGNHDPDYVDAYYGPEAWRTEAETSGLTLTQILGAAGGLLDRLGEIVVDEADGMLGVRHRHLTRQVQALGARVQIVAGRQLQFDDESYALYDAVAPTLSEEHFSGLTADLDDALPGRGPVSARYERFRQAFVIPPERLDTVFTAAIDACRERTLRHLELPEGESFTVEYVTDKSWSGYNWYQGGFASLIQVNTDLPIYIDRAIDLACHEGYPGHHVYNMFLEKHLVVDRGWVEFSVYPLFSPQSLIAEGSANYGIEIAFPRNERVEFERSVLFPLAGLDPERTAEYYRVQDLVERLDFAGNEAARQYLNGDMTAVQAIEWLETFALMPTARAQQRIRFVDQYRSYVINYNLGKDIVARYVEALAGDDPERAWEEFGRLLSSPRIPSELIQQ